MHDRALAPTGYDNCELESAFAYMLRLLTAALTVALAVFSSIQVTTAFPSLTSSILTRTGSIVPARQVVGPELYLICLLQIILAAAFLIAPYAAADSIHFGPWCLGRYTAEKRDRILPSLRELMGLLALLISLCFAGRIYFRIHDARSHGPLLPVDWLDRVVRTDLESLLALGLVGWLVIYYYLGKFDELAGKE